MEKISPRARSIDDRIILHAHQEIEIQDESHDLIISIGGVGSGKTLTLALWMLTRSRWDTGQMHALFAYTSTQLRAVCDRIYQVLDRVGVQRVFNCRPPKRWVEEWKRRGIETPTTRDRYENVLILRTGFHCQFGTLHNRSYEQHRGAEWGSAAIEEFTLKGVTQEGIEYILDRIRCGRGPEFCREHHRHQKYLHGNPPEDDGHWVFDWLANLEKQAAELSGDTAERPHGDDYSHLYRGVGPAILIPSRTKDNEANLSHRYIENQMSRLDAETAERRLGGKLTRSKKGRVYSAFSRENEYPIAYDPNRTVYLFLDFNINPAVAGFAHPLNQGEYPSDYTKPDRKYVGVFGEFFHVGGMDAYDLARAVLKGDRGSDGAFPENWKGLAKHRAKVIAFGDATARNRQMSGPNAWQVVNEVFRDGLRGEDGRALYAVDIPSSGNPLVIFSTRAVNARFEAADGTRCLFIDPRCNNLMADLNVCLWDKSGTDIQKWGQRGGSEMWKRTHLSDGLRYMIHQLFPLGRDVGPRDNLPRVELSPRIVIPTF